mmetsp:Transcript_43684/g.79713  ORF Transcript_43684/g.79713 Transcript_43684/m.79713 type:complete len:271 (+) Transcript_43684:129-941(+)
MEEVPIPPSPPISCHTRPAKATYSSLPAACSANQLPGGPSSHCASTRGRSLRASSLWLAQCCIFSRVRLKATHRAAGVAGRPGFTSVCFSARNSDMCKQRAELGSLGWPLPVTRLKVRWAFPFAVGVCKGVPPCWPCAGVPPFSSSRHSFSKLSRSLSSALADSSKAFHTSKSSLLKLWELACDDRCPLVGRNFETTAEDHGGTVVRGHMLAGCARRISGAAATFSGAVFSSGVVAQELLEHAGSSIGAFTAEEPCLTKGLLAVLALSCN